jgi:hypothetical protein
MQALQLANLPANEERALPRNGGTPETRPPPCRWDAPCWQQLELSRKQPTLKPRTSPPQGGRRAATIGGRAWMPGVLSYCFARESPLCVPALLPPWSEPAQTIALRCDVRLSNGEQEGQGLKATKPATSWGQRCRSRRARPCAPSAINGVLQLRCRLGRHHYHPCPPMKQGPAANSASTGGSTGRALRAQLRNTFVLGGKTRSGNKAGVRARRRPLNEDPGRGNVHRFPAKPDRGRGRQLDEQLLADAQANGRAVLEVPDRDGADLRWPRFARSHGETGGLGRRAASHCPYEAGGQANGRERQRRQNSGKCGLVRRLLASPL